MNVFGILTLFFIQPLRVIFLRLNKPGLSGQIKVSRSMTIIFSVLLLVLISGCIGESKSVNSDSGIGSGEIQTDKGKISYTFKGNEELGRIIYIHGTPGDKEGWSYFIENSFPGFQSIAYDRIGFGANDRNIYETSFAEHVKTLESFLQENKVNILVGHSMGATLALKAAIMIPEKISAIILLSGAYDKELEKIRWIQRFGDKWLSWIIPSSLYNSNKELLAYPSELEMMEDQLANINIPMAVIHGSEDSLVPAENFSFLKKIRGDRVEDMFVMMEGKGHLIIWKNSREVRGYIEKFMRLQGFLN